MLSPYDDDLIDLGQLLDKECDVSDENIRDLADERWAQIEKMYRNQPGSSGQQNIVENYSSFTVPLLKPLIKRVVQTTHRQFIKAEPMVIAVSEDGDIDGAQAVERLLESVFRRANVDFQGLRTLETAALHGKGIFRFWPSPSGFLMEPVHSKQTTVYPSYAETIEDCKTVGHKFYYRKHKVIEMMSMPYGQGGWMKCDLDDTSDDPKKDQAGRDKDYDRQSYEPSIVEESDAGVEIRDLFTYREFKGSVGWLRVILAKSSKKVLRVEPMKGSPWYFDQALHYEYGSFWTSSSLANELQGMQHLYTDLHNLLVVGSYTAAFPPVFLTGGSMGEKKWQHRIGAVYQLPGAVTFQTVPLQFNPGVIPSMIQQCEKVGQTIAGVTAAGQGQQFTSHTTKAEVDLLAENQSNADEGYLMTASMVYSRVGKYVLEHLRNNPDYAAKHYGHVLSQGWDTAKVRLEPSGRTVGDQPQTIVQKLQAAGQIVQMYGLSQSYDIIKIGEAALAYLGLPFPLDRFKRAINADGTMAGPVQDPSQAVDPNQAGNAPQGLDMPQPPNPMLGGG